MLAQDGMEEALDSALQELFSSESGDARISREAGEGGSEGDAPAGKEQATVRRHSLELAALQGEITLLSSRLEEANRQRGALAAQRDELANKLSATQHETAAFRRERDHALGRLEELTRENERLRAQNKALQDEIDALTGRAERMVATLQKLDGSGDSPAEMTGGFEQPELLCLQSAGEDDQEEQSFCDPADFPLLSDLQGGFPTPGEAEWGPLDFQLNPTLSSIAYGSPDQVLELYQSVNVAYLSPEGKGQENCQGFVCAVAEGGRRQVMAAFFGLQSGKTRVYLPEKQPADDGSLIRAIEGAVGFAEQVGFVMESLKAGRPPQQFRDLVLHCPVLQSPRKLD